MTDCPREIATDMLFALRVANDVLDKNRLSGLDQNPKGVRDLVYSAMRAGDRWVLKLQENCEGHVASSDDPKRCARCGLYVDDLRPPDEDEVHP